MLHLFFSKSRLLIIKVLAKLFYGACILFYSFEGLSETMEQVFKRARVYKLRKSLAHCGRELYIQFPLTITQPEKVRLGERVSLAAYVHIWGGGMVTIGNRVMIGTHTSISSLTHDYNQEVMFDTLIANRVIIEDDVWIGSNCVILPNVKIGKGAVIGAGSVVTKDVEPRAIVIGVPAHERSKR